LLLILRQYAEIEESERRDIVQAAQDIVAVVNAVGGLSGSTLAMLALADRIKDWRNKVREQGGKPDVKLQRPGQPPLDLATAPDTEIDALLDPRRQGSDPA